MDWLYFPARKEIRRRSRRSIYFFGKNLTKGLIRRIEARAFFPGARRASPRSHARQWDDSRLRDSAPG